MTKLEIAEHLDFLDARLHTLEDSRHPIGAVQEYQQLSGRQGRARVATLRAALCPDVVLTEQHGYCERCPKCKVLLREANDFTCKCPDGAP